MIKRVVFTLFALCLLKLAMANTVSKALEYIVIGKRKEGFQILDKIFLKSKEPDKSAAANLLTSAHPGEAREDPGFYADYLLQNRSGLKADAELRLLRMSGDYFLKKSKFDPANARFDELAQKGGPDEKDYSEYKKAWVLVNQGRHADAIEKMRRLLIASSKSKLALSVAFDMGRFWGEAEAKDRKTTEIDSALASADLRKEFFRGLQKSLQFPKKRADRDELRQRAAGFRDSTLLIEMDLEANAASPDLACEKLIWARWPQQIAKIKSDSPYKMLLQCFGEDEGKMRKLKDHERPQLLAFLGALTGTQDKDVLHKARFTSNLSEFPTACREYRRYMSLKVPKDSALCEEVSEICFKALEQRASVEDAAAVFESAFPCATRDASSKSLRLAAKLYEIKPDSINKFVFNSKNKESLNVSLLPDVLYESALKRGDKAYAQKIGKNFFFEKAATSNERKKSLEHFLSQEGGTLGGNADKIAAVYPLKGPQGYNKANVSVWVKAARTDKNNSSIFREVLAACSAPALVQDGNADLRDFCQENAEVPVAMAWVKGNKINCERDAILVLRGWTDLEGGRSIAGPAFERSFLKETFGHYSQKDFVKASKLQDANCPKKHPINQHLKTLAEIQKAKDAPIGSTATLASKIKFVKAKLAAIPQLPFIHEKTKQSERDAMIALIDKLETSLPGLAVKEPDAAQVLNEFKGVFASWKKELK